MNEKQKRGIGIMLLIIAFLICAKITSAIVPMQLSDQGTSVKDPAGQTLNTGNLTIEIYDAETGGNLVWNYTFYNAIVNGSWNIMLGETLELNLSYNYKYWKDYRINGYDLNYTNDTGGIVPRRAFYSPLGEVGKTFVENSTNVFVDIGGDIMTGALNLSSGNLYVYDNISALNIVPLNEVRGITVRNGSGGKIGFFNTTGNRFEVWNPAEGAGDYMSVWHDGISGFINSASGDLNFYLSGASKYGMGTTTLYPSSSNIRDLGTNNVEWRALYLGENASSGAYFGLDQDWRQYYNTTADALIFENKTSSPILALQGGKIGIGTISPSHTLTVAGDLNVTGTSYLGNLIISAENISTTNILPLNQETGVTIRNGSGGKLGFFNTTGNRFEVWNPLEGANDYVSIYHDGTHGIINAQSGNLYTQLAGGSKTTLTTAAFSPSSSQLLTLGDTSLEWKSLYLGEDASSGAYFGLDQNWRLWYNETSKDELQLDASGNTNFSIDAGLLFVNPTDNKIGIGTTTPSHTLNIVGDLNVTGTSYLGNLIISAENISTTNILPLNQETGVTIRNGSGGKLIFANTTSGRLEVWSPLEGAGDYVNIYHDGSVGYVTAASGILRLTGTGDMQLFSNGDYAVWDGNRFYSSTNLKDLGTTGNEWRAQYLGEDASSGAYFGLDQDSRIWYNNTNRSLFIESTAANVSVVAPEFRVWDDARGEADYVSVYHDATDGYVKAISGNLKLDSANYIMAVDGVLPAVADSLNLGGTSYEWKALYVSEDAGSGTYFGLDQDSRIWYNNTNRSLFIESTAANVTVVAPELRVWDDARGEGDYVRIYHDGNNANINTGGASDVLWLGARGTQGWFTDGADFIPNGYNNRKLGSSTAEIQTIYLGENASSGAYFGLDQDWRQYYNTTADALIFENKTSSPILALQGGKIGIGTTEPGQELTIIGDLNVTGTSYLGNLIISAENISTTNILPLNQETGVTIRNGSGGKLIFANTTSGKLEVWNPLEAAGDYTEISHTGSIGRIKSGSGGFQILTPTYTWTFSDAGALYQAANTGSLGVSSSELLNLYLGEDASSGAYFGLDQNWRLWYNETSKDELQLDASGNTNFSIDAGLLFVNPTDNKIGIGTTTPSHTLNIVGDLNVTGTSYLGNLIIQAENISTTNILALNKDLGVTFRNDTGGALLRVNMTSGKTEFWNPAEGANDYVSIYHDATSGYVSTASGNIVLVNPTTGYTFSGASIIPSNSNYVSIGGTTTEIKGLYLGEDAASGAYFGLDQDSRIWYNNTNATLFIESTAANVSVVAPEFRVWDEARGEGDYVSIYHDGTNGYVSSASGLIGLVSSSSTVAWDGTEFYSGINSKTLGVTTGEWRALYLGNGTSSGAYFGMGQESTLLMSNAQATAPTMVWGLPNTNGYGNSLIFASNTYLTDNYDHPAQTNPTLFVQANEDPDANNDRWISVTHDNSSAVIDSGYGNITLDDHTNIAGNLVLSDNLVGEDSGRMCYNGTRTVWEGYSYNNDLWSCGPEDDGTWACVNSTGTGFSCT